MELIYNYKEHFFPRRPCVRSWWDKGHPCWVMAAETRSTTQKKPCRMHYRWRSSRTMSSGVYIYHHVKIMFSDTCNHNFKIMFGVCVCVIMLKPCYLVCVCVCNHVKTMLSGVDCSCKNCVCTCNNVCNNQKCFMICVIIISGVHVITLEPWFPLFVLNHCVRNM